MVLHATDAMGYRAAVADPIAASMHPQAPFAPSATALLIAPKAASLLHLTVGLPT